MVYKSGGSYCTFWGCVCHILCENPFINGRAKGSLRHTIPHFMPYFRGTFPAKSELCVLLFFMGEINKCSRNPDLVNQLSATPGRQLHWTGPIANNSELIPEKIEVGNRNYRGRELNPNIFFSNFSGTPGISRQNSGGLPPKEFDFPGFEGRTELFGPSPFMCKTPTPPENIRTQKFGFVLFFRA